MLIDNQGREHFSGQSRGQINHIAGGKSPAGQERRQAAMLAPLTEIHTLKHTKQQGFSLGERARYVQ